MQPKSLDDRVTLLEKQMQGLPEKFAALEGQFLLFRTEVRGEFSTLRKEFRADLKAEGEAIRNELRKEIHDGDDMLHREIVELRKDMREGDEETRRYMRVLHEEVLDRIKTISRG